MKPDANDIAQNSGIDVLRDLIDHAARWEVPVDLAAVAQTSNVAMATVTEDKLVATKHEYIQSPAVDAAEDTYGANGKVSSVYINGRDDPSAADQTQFNGSTILPKADITHAREEPIGGKNKINKDSKRKTDIKREREQQEQPPQVPKAPIDKGPPPDQVIDPNLAEMNEKYAVVQIGGRTRVMHFEDDATYPGCKVPVFQTIADFKAFQHKHKIRMGKKKFVGRGYFWIENPLRRQYDSVVYAPGAKPEDGKLNLWQGFACESKPGDCSLYLAHLRENICRGNEEHFAYLLNWMARGVQQPDKQGEVAVVMRGREGTGKGVAAKNYGRLFGAHYRHVAHAHHLTGNFNAHQLQCSVLFADEALFAGDRSHEGILKFLITEDTLQIELKGIDTFTARNRMHILMASNSAWVVPAGADARRYFVLDVGDAHLQDVPYFTAITKQMDNGGREAFLHLLKTRNISDFNVRAVPQTGALADQKRHSRRGIDALVEHLAIEGELWEVRPGYPSMCITSEREGKRSFYQRAKSAVEGLDHVKWIIAQRILKEEWGCRHWRANGLNGLEFPPLPSLRAMFNMKHGEQEWNRPDDDWGATGDDERGSP